MSLVRSDGPRLARSSCISGFKGRDSGTWVVAATGYLPAELTPERVGPAASLSDTPEPKTLGPRYGASQFTSGWTTALNQETFHTADSVAIAAWPRKR